MAHLPSCGYGGYDVLHTIGNPPPINEAACSGPLTAERPHSALYLSKDRIRYVQPLAP